MAGQDFVCGARLTLGDILLFCFVDFGRRVGQPTNPELTNVIAHHARMAARPSAAA
jgi:glutathione S-transferase